jgi:hypothetical protein
MKNILKVGYRSKNYHTNEGAKAFLKGRNPVLFVNFGQFPCSWILICIPNTDPDPRQPNECGFRWIRIHKTGLNYKKSSVLCGILVTKVLFMLKKEAIPDYVRYHL